MARHDWAGAKARHRLSEVVRRTGIDLPVNAGTVKVRCVMPDHEDRTPSMDLHLDEDRYYCHGCKAHGDQVQWIVDVYQVSKVEALVMLERPGPFGPPPGGVPVIDRHGTEWKPGPARPPAERPDPARTPRARVLAAVAAAWSYYTYGFLHDAGTEYLRRRGIDVTALEADEQRPVVGRTPYRGERRLADHLHQRGFSDDELVDAGLMIRRHGADPIDFFRHRIILPVREPAGQVVGLIGRYDDTSHDLPPGGVKYLNMARTCVYDKSSPAGLYRPTSGPLDRDGQVVICEGTIDALAIAAAAATAGRASKFAPVAESGTAISPAQWQTILAMTPTPPVLCGDGDPTGQSASLRWATDAATAGRETCITRWPQGHDPASWLATHGLAGLAAVTRRGCLAAPDYDLRPVPAAAMVARHLARSGRAEQAAAHVQRVVERAARMADAKHYASVVAEAATAVAVSEQAHADQYGRLDQIVERVASWGSRIGDGARPLYCAAAGQELAREGLGPDRWLIRKVIAAVDTAVWADNGRGVELAETISQKREVPL
jgi:DNA primase